MNENNSYFHLILACNKIFLGGESIASFFLFTIYVYLLMFLEIGGKEVPTPNGRGVSYCVSKKMSLEGVKLFFWGGGGILMGLILNFSCYFN